MATQQTGFLTEEYAGYHHNHVPAEDPELTHVGSWHARQGSISGGIGTR